MLAPFDLVINAVPGFMGYATARTIVEAGKNSVCIAFYEEDPFLLDKAARENGVTMIMDCGVYPGMGSALIMEATLQLDSVHSVTTFVGGLPKVREWPSEYKAVFSPADVIEEYTRPARYIENGHEVVRPALSDPEFLFFPGIGTLEAFNTDGLRTLRQTIDAPNMKEKTLRYPGHIEKMVFLREAGFFSESPVEVGGRAVRPVDVTAELLFPQWQMEDGETDITVLRIVIEGERDGATQRIVYNMTDRADHDSNTHSMARTTGYTATAAVRMLSEGLYAEPGIAPPEFIGRHQEPFDFMVRCLRERRVICREEVSGGTPVLV